MSDQPAPCRLTLSIAACLTLAPLSRPVQAAWGVVDLGGPDPARASCALAMNGNGVAAGSIDVSGGKPNALQVSLTGALSTIPPLPGHYANQAAGIGTWGAVVGWSHFDYKEHWEPSRRAFLYVPAYVPAFEWPGNPSRPAQLIDLHTGAALGQAWSHAHDVNGSAVVVGEIHPFGTALNQAFKSEEVASYSWQQGSGSWWGLGVVFNRQTTALAPHLGNAVISRANGINDAGVIVGKVVRSFPMRPEPFVLDASGPIYLGAALTSPLSGEATDISANGIVVGYQATYTDYNYPPAGVIGARSFRWKDVNGNRAVDAGEASFPGPGFDSVPRAVNQHGTVVGTARFNNNTWTPYISFGGDHMMMLTVNLPLGWQLTQANAIDDSYRIIGCARNHLGVERAVLLTLEPDSEDSRDPL